MVPWHFVSSNDRSGLPRRACRHRQSYASLPLLLFLVCHLPLHRTEVVGCLKGAIKAEGNVEIAKMLDQVCLMTVVSWCTYPVVYLFPFLGISGSSAVVAIQVGYCASDVISKCGVGLLIYNITLAKSQAIKLGALLPQ